MIHPTRQLDTPESKSPRKLAVRFATGTPEGKLCSAIWGIWKSKASKDDIYIAVRSLGHQLKCALHEKGYCYLGFTRPEFDRMAAIGRAPARREWVQWRRPATPENGFAVAVEIMLAPSPPSEANGRLDGKPTWIMAPPPPGKGVVVSVVFSRVPKGDLSIDPMSTRELGYASLSTGEYVAVFAQLAEFDYKAFLRNNLQRLQDSIGRVVPADSEYLDQPLQMFLVTEKQDGMPLRLLDVSVTISKSGGDPTKSLALVAPPHATP